jgi:hypothetical protein
LDLSGAAGTSRQRSDQCKVIVIAAGIVVWLYFAQPDNDPFGLVIVGWGIIVWLGGSAIRYLLAGR